MNIAQAGPSVAQLSGKLTGAFEGSGLMRYGLFSAEIDVQYVGVSSNQTLADIRGRKFGATESGSLLRVAPGVGLTVASGDIASIPSMLDMRAGVAYFAWDAKINGNSNSFGGANASDSFIQPWLGARASFFPTPKWRVVVEGLIQGFGLDGGSWGWGASALTSYAFTDWFNLTIGYRALDSARAEGSGQMPFPDRRSISVLAYGPFLGVGFRF